MQRNTGRLFFFGLLTLAVMIMIFMMSSQNGASSGGLSAWLLSTSFGKFLLRILPRLTEQGGEHDLRKYAHMGEYMLLGMSASGFFRELLIGRRLPAPMACTACFCFLYACSDEWHQSFVPDRVGCFTDVLIDMIGVLTALAIFCLFCLHRKEKR